MAGWRMAVCLVLGLAVAGCAKPPQQREQAAALPAHAYTAVDTALTTASAGPSAAAPAGQPMPPRPGAGLAGRTLAVASATEIVLRPGEVILTFDDGPRPGRTDAILDTLDAYGVAATFMMLGQAAERHPELVRKVAQRGHTIGTHTYDHANLAQLGNAAAMGEIAAGEAAVARALAPIGRSPEPFFRFPYLAETGVLRTSLADARLIVLGVDIDSKDYYAESAETVLARTLDRLEARGRGIILFHDIHARTVALLPGFLEKLAERGYSVVRLAAKEHGPFARDLVIAEGAGPARGGS